jgi:hypothetical protein
MVPAAIELFGEHETCKFVRERPRGDREPAMGPRAHDVAEPMRAADHERHVLRPLALLLEHRGEGAGVHRLPPGSQSTRRAEFGSRSSRRSPSFRITTASLAVRADSSFTSTTSSGQ